MITTSQYVKNISAAESITISGIMTPTHVFLINNKIMHVFANMLWLNICIFENVHNVLSSVMTWQQWQVEETKRKKNV